MKLVKRHDASLSLLSREVHSLIEAGRFGDALDGVRSFVESVIFDPRSVARVFMSPELDQLCRSVGEAVTTTADLPGYVGKRRRGAVIVATELVMAGGHVELIKDIIRLGLFMPPLTLVLTDCFGRVDPQVVSSFESQYQIPVVVASGRNTDERLWSTFLHLRERAPKDLVLLTHNQDGIGVSLACADCAERVTYIHHADHHLSLGVSCTEFVHVDPHNIGFFHCRNELRVTDNRYWPLTVNCNNLMPRSLDFLRKGKLVTCSSGRASKFEAGSYLYDYINFVPKLLSVRDGVHIHIGDMSADMYESIVASLLSMDINPSRFIHIEWVPSIARALIENNVDLYVSSFPMGGGKAMVEAMAVGIPLLMHDNYRTHFFSGLDISYPKAFKWRTESEFVDVVSKVTVEMLAEHSGAARRHYNKFHSDQALVAASNFDVPQAVEDVPPLRSYRSDSLQTFLDDKFESDLSEKAHLGEIARINDEWSKAMSIIGEQKEEIESISTAQAKTKRELQSIRVQLKSWQFLIKQIKNLVLNKDG